MEDNMDIIKVKYLLRYLKILQRGRKKPNTKGEGGTVSESMENISDIKAVKKELNKMLNLEE